MSATRDNFANACDSRAQQVWKTGLLRRVDYLLQVFEDNNIPGTLTVNSLHIAPDKRHAWLSLDIALDEYEAPCTYDFMIADQHRKSGSNAGYDRYHVFPASTFIVKHESETFEALMDGYALDHGDHGWYERLIADLIKNARNDGSPRTIPGASALPLKQLH
ncbi:MAG: hypothetical protein H6867_06145 [Rhodospirillales bacterium]|nr:hypothetical protein [Rhodospirillales bacterium]MCB9995110.1 hypothetical protein [Rhodospirillales bacterium]